MQILFHIRQISKIKKYFFKQKNNLTWLYFRRNDDDDDDDDALVEWDKDLGGDGNVDFTWAFFCSSFM